MRELAISRKGVFMKKHILFLMVVCLFALMPVLAFSQTNQNEPIRSVLIRNSTGGDIYYFFIRKTGDSDNWTEDLLDYAEVYIIEAGDIEDVFLENPLNSANRYDLLAVDDDENLFVKRNIQLSKNIVIEFTRNDMDNDFDPD